MTIIDLVPLRSARQRDLAELLCAVGAALRADGVGPHEYAVQTVARAARNIAPGASASLINSTTPGAARIRAFDVVARVVVRCGDDATGELLTGALARYAVDRPARPVATREVAFTSA